MSINVNDNGVFKVAKEVYIHDGSVWQEPLEIYVHNGTSFVLTHKRDTLSANAADVNLYTLVGSPTLPITLKVVINSGVTISSSSASVPALTIGAFPVGSQIYLINNGTITGAGGTGGLGAIIGTRYATAGTSGGDAILANFPVYITNNGIISGGGGGGGGGGVTYYTYTVGTSKNATTYSAYSYGGGGGGGAGIIAGVGGSGATISNDGSSGTSTTGGAGGGSTHTPGGAGGSRGAVGAAGTGGNVYGAGAGGATGASVRNNSNVTWISSGTLFGALV